MNLLDSHDTERLLWTLTPGNETTADKELNAANLTQGKRRQMLASLIQFTLPGAPTVFYGDEVAMTGDDDPDDRRTYPWADLGGNPDTAMFTHYRWLSTLRQISPALTRGDFSMLLADDAAGTVAYGRRINSHAVVVVLNRSTETRAVQIPVAGYLPDGVRLVSVYKVGNTGNVSVQVAGGMINVDLAPQSAWILATGIVDLRPPSAPNGLTVTDEGNGEVSLSWNAVSGAASYNLYRSPLSGGGWVRVNASALTATNFTDTGLRNGQTYYYVVTAIDNHGNESDYSNEASALPHLTIGWANLQWPPTITHTISATDRTDTVYGQVWIDGVTNLPGPTPSLIAQAGFGPEGSNPDGNAAWRWEPASFNVNAGNNDEFQASFLPQAVGTFDYVYRYSTTNGAAWLYADLNGPIATGSLPPNPGKLTVNSTGDITPPAAPTNLNVTGASPAAISLGWDVHPNTDGDLAGFEVHRDGSLLATVLNPSATSYTDSAVTENQTYIYTVLAFDSSFNRSGPSNSVSATAEPRTVTLIFTVTVPATTDATGRSVYIAGLLDRLHGNLPQWDPGGVVLTRSDATHWTIMLTGDEGVQIEYKYALGSWDFVEKDDVCGEIANRQLTLSYGTDGNMPVNDTAANWRNVAPCGN
jgi:hypothetical protein